MLADIAARIKSAPKSKPIGGILLEPIVGAGGVLFYRPEFLKRLRELCTDAGVPLIADEILTCGGRTGKFFAYEHYDKFEPDLVLFGKGLIVAGIAFNERAPLKWNRYAMSGSGTTIQHQPETLLKATQVLTRIKEGNLVANAKKIGSYLLDRMNEMEDPSAPQETRPRGIGLLLYHRGGILDAEDGMGRYMPPLTLSKQDVDTLLPFPIEPTGGELLSILKEQGFKKSRGSIPEVVQVERKGRTWGTVTLRFRPIGEKEKVPPELMRELIRSISSNRDFVDPQVIPTLVRQTKSLESAMLSATEAGFTFTHNANFELFSLVQPRAGQPPIVHLLHKQDGSLPNPKEIEAFARAIEAGKAYHSPGVEKERNAMPKMNPAAKVQLKRAKSIWDLIHVLTENLGWVAVEGRRKVTLVHPFEGKEITLPRNARSQELIPSVTKGLIEALEAGQSWTLPETTP